MKVWLDSGVKLECVRLFRIYLDNCADFQETAAALDSDCEALEEIDILNFYGQQRLVCKSKGVEFAEHEGRID